MSDSDDVPPVLLLGFAPNERARERRCVSAHECKVLADSYGFQHREVDFDSDMTPLLQRMVADIRREEFEALVEESSTPLVDMIVLGDVFVGKTSIVNRLLSGDFDNKYVSSGFMRPRKVKVLVDDSLAVLRLRDTPGATWQSVVASDVMQVVHSALVVYDVTSRVTFETAQAIRQSIISTKQDRRLSFVLVGNKCEDQFLAPRQVTYEEGLSLAKSWKCPFFEVSTKSGTVDHMFREAIREYRLIFNYDLISSPKLEWSGALQINDSGKFSKKHCSVGPGMFSYASKPDMAKAKHIDLNNSKVGVIEGNHDKGALLILSLIGSPQVQCLLPSISERSALADALFGELALQTMVQELYESALREVVTETLWPDDTEDNECILAHGRLPSSSSILITNQSPSPPLANNNGTVSAGTSASSPNALSQSHPLYSVLSTSPTQLRRR